MKPLPRIGRLSFGLGYLIFAGVFLLRLLVLSRLTASPLLLPSRGDMHFYNDWARHILHGELAEHLAFYGLPGYPYLLALLYKIFGYNPFVPSLFQAGFDAGTAVLIYQLTLRVFPASRSFPGVLGVIASLGWAFFVPAQAYAVILMPTVWFVFAFWFVVWRIVRNNNAPTGRECLLLGFLIGFSAMGIATIVILVPLVLAALLIKAKIGNRHWRSFALGAALLLIGVGLGTSPCWIHNCFIARDPVFLSAHSGINFWIGNNPTAKGYPGFPPGLRAGQAAMLEDSITQAEAAAGRSLKRSEVSDYWSRKAKNYIAAHFSDWLKLLALKLYNFWNAFQYDDLSVITNLREQGVIVPGLYFGMVAALALPGMLLAWRLAPSSRWIAVAILLPMFALLTVFITERYRLVAVPGLLIFAAFGLSIFWQACATNKLRIATVYLALLVGSTIFVSAPQRDPSLWALDAYNSGWQALESRNLALAQKKLDLAYAYVPGNAEINLALGNLWFERKNSSKARGYYQAVLKIDPRHKAALNNLGVLALNEKQWEVAIKLFRASLEVSPNDAKTHYLLARVKVESGDTAGALLEIETAVRLKPNQPEFAELLETIRRQR